MGRKRCQHAVNGVGALGKVWQHLVQGWELRDGGMGSGVCM